MAVSKKIIATVLVCTLFFCLIVILATCSLFSPSTVDVSSVNWRAIIKNSSWNYSEKSVDDSLIIPALKSVKSISFGDDFSAVVEYTDGVGNSYYFSCGALSFSSDDSASLSVCQNSLSGLVSNSISVKFSDQSSQQFDNKSYIMTFTVSNGGSTAGTITFFAP